MVNVLQFERGDVVCWFSSNHEAERLCFHVPRRPSVALFLAVRQNAAAARQLSALFVHPLVSVQA